MIAGILATRSQFLPFTITQWLLDQPFTVLIDLVNNHSFPLPYRVGAASVAKLVTYQVVTRWGGSTFEVEWQNSMVARQIAGTPGFAQIWYGAPIITGFDVSAVLNRTGFSDSPN